MECCNVTTDTLDLPVITEPAQAEKVDLPAVTDPKKVDLQAVALAHFGDWRADVAAAKQNLSTLVLDLSIPARITDAKGLRQRLINGPIADVRATSKGLKSKLAAVSKAVGAEEELAVAAYTEAGQLITPKIEAAEQAIETARKQREEEAAKRIADLKVAVDAKLTPWLDRCNAEGMTAERVAAGAAALGELTMPPEFADVAAYWAERLSATSRTMESRRLALAAAELEAAQAKMRAETQRVAGIQARIAEIRAAATGHDKATAADLAEARIVVAALDVSEAIYAEFTGLAEATQAATLAALDKLHGEAWAREEAAAAAEADRRAQMIAEAAKLPRLPDERVGQIMRDLAQPLPLTIPEGALFEDTTHEQQLAAVSDRLDLAEYCALKAAAEGLQPGAVAPVAQDGVAENPVQSQPEEPHPLPSGDATAVRAAVDEGAATPVDSTAPGVTPEPTMTLGMLNEFIAPLKIDAAGLELLGFPVAGRRKAAMLYHDTDRPAIVAALVKHLQGL